MKFNGKYDTLIESTITRFEQGGLLSGDLVKFRKDAMKNEKIKALTDQYKAMIENAINTDLNLRVGAIKSIRPTTGGYYGGGQNSGTRSPTDHFVDVVVEYAPGLWRDPITVPIEVLERVDTGINLAPVPDSLKRPSKSEKPKEVESPDADRKMTDKNEKPKHVGSVTDGRTQIKKPKEMKVANQGKLTLEDVYSDMANKQASGASSNPSQPKQPVQPAGGSVKSATGVAKPSGAAVRNSYSIKFGEPYGKNGDEVIKKIQTMPGLSNNMDAKFDDDNTLTMTVDDEHDPKELQNMISNVVKGSVQVSKQGNNPVTSFNTQKKPAVVTGNSAVPAA